MAVRLRGDTASFEQKLRETAAHVAPDLRLYDVMTLEEAIWQDDFGGVLMTASIVIPVLIVLLLSTAALFALMSASVARRTREIGIRRTVGATPRGLLTALFKQAGLQRRPPPSAAAAAVRAQIDARPRFRHSDNANPTSVTCPLVLRGCGTHICASHVIGSTYSSMRNGK